MQRDIDFNANDIDLSNDSSKASTELFTKKKRNRSYKHSKYSEKDEEKILKYALKLSKKEYQINFKNQEKQELSDSLSNIPECKTIFATEEELKNPINFFDNLWSEGTASSGIIKIVAPESWKANQAKKIQEIFLPKFKTLNKKLNTRKQELNQLFLAKVKIRI